MVGGWGVSGWVIGPLETANNTHLYQAPKSNLHVLRYEYAVKQVVCRPRASKHALNPTQGCSSTLIYMDPSTSLLINSYNVDTAGHCYLVAGSATFTTTASIALEINAQATETVPISHRFIVFFSHSTLEARSTFEIKAVASGRR